MARKLLETKGKITNLNETIIYKSYFCVPKGEEFKQETLTNPIGIKKDNNYIIKLDNSYLYIVNNVLITVRVGYSEKLLDILISSKCEPLDYTLKFNIDKQLREQTK